MSTFRVLTDHSDIVKYIQPVMQSMGSEIPAQGQGVVFTQFGDSGNVEAFQILQTAIFAEGLVSLTPKSNLRKIWHMMRDWLNTKCDMKGKQLWVVASTEKMGRVCEAMGCEKMDWSIYRRKF